MSFANVVIVSTWFSTLSWGWSHGGCILSIMQNRSFFPLSTKSYFSALGPRSRPCPGASGSSSPRESQSDQRERERERRVDEEGESTWKYICSVDIFPLSQRLAIIEISNTLVLKYQTLLHSLRHGVQYCGICTLCLSAMTAPLKELVNQPIHRCNVLMACCIWCDPSRSIFQQQIC